MKSVKKSSTEIAHYALPICLLEIGPGALLHGLKLPFTGFFLSLNQLFILVYAQKKLHVDHRFASYEISTVVSLFKTLSPVGKRLTPMIAISAQGALFNLPFILTSTPALLCHLIGSLLFSLWGAFQPLLLNYLIFGETFFYSFDYFIKKMKKKYTWIGISDLVDLILIVVVFRVLVAIVVTLISYYRSDYLFERWRSLISSKVVLGKQSEKSFGKQLLRDLTRPLFLFSLVVSSLYLYFQSQQVTTIVWYLGRVLIVTLFLVYILRVFRFDSLFKKLDQTRFKKLSSVAKEILNYIRSE